VVIYDDDDIVFCEDKADNKVKKCATLNEWKLCCVKLDTYLSPTSNGGKENEVKNYHKYGELVWVFFTAITLVFFMYWEFL